MASGVRERCERLLPRGWAALRALDEENRGVFCLSATSKLLLLRKLLATELSWDRPGDHNTTPRRPEGDVEPHRVCLLVCY